MKKMKLSLLCLSALFCLYFLGISDALCQSPPTLADGIKQYQSENYEEAIDILTKVRKLDPKSTMAAFFLGMAYKQTNNMAAAEQNLKDATISQPAIKEAAVELIDVLYQLGKLDEAKTWIGVAEKNNIFPAKIAFLKGMISSSEGKYQPAIEAFEQSKKLDPAYTQSADLQIGVCYVNLRKYDMAKARFQTAITQDPLSDLGSFARRYQDLVEERSFLERPLRVTLSALGQYDTNVLSQPTPNEYWKNRTGIDFWSQDKASSKLQTTARLDYVPILTGPFTFNASYAAAAGFQEKYSTSYDLIANTISANPGLAFGRFMVNLAGNYTHVMKRDPGYTRYSENYSVGPLFSFLAAPNHILEASAAYAGKNYFAAISQPELWDQSTTGLDSYLSWFWMFGNGGGLLNLKYGYTNDSARGAYFDNQGHRFTANFMTPLFWKPLRLQLGGDIYLQGYKNENATYDNVKRSDQTYTGTAGLYWDLSKNITLITQWVGTWVNSNIFIYDYSRHVFSAGFELRF